MKDAKLTIKEVGTYEAAQHLGYLADVPDRKRVESEPITEILTKMLNSRYHTMLSFYNGEVSGMLIYEIIDNDTIGFKFLNCRKHTLKYIEQFTEYIMKNGYTKVRYETIHGERIWSRLFGEHVKPRTINYELDLAGLKKEQGE